MANQNQRYCPMCDVWVPARETVCVACGMTTERPEPVRKTLAEVWAEEDDREHEESR
jgi:uncharacterized paraquat-inducible protein A